VARQRGDAAGRAQREHAYMGHSMVNVQPQPLCLRPFSIMNESALRLPLARWFESYYKFLKRASARFKTGNTAPTDLFEGHYRANSVVIESGAKAKVVIAKACAAGMERRVDSMVLRAGGGRMRWKPRQTRVEPRSMVYTDHELEWNSRFLHVTGLM
jgi:hypothetical protein